MSLGSDITTNSQVLATVYRLYDGNTPVVIFDFPNHSPWAKHTQDKIKALCSLTNEYWGPESEKRILTDEEKHNVFEFLRYDCRPKDAKGIVFGYSQKQLSRPIGHDFKFIEELYRHIIGQLDFRKTGEFDVRDITVDALA